MAKPTKADAVRDFAYNNYIAPAREKKLSLARIKSGDIAKALDMGDRMPLICSAIEAQAFRVKHGLRLLNRTGPHAGATVTWTFSV